MSINFFYYLLIANILEANIDWAAITTLSAAVASMVKADIGSADIDFAHIKDMVTDTAIITKGVGGKLFIADLAVTEANMASLTVGELVVKGEDGHFYALSVDDEGNVTTTLKQISNDDVEDLSINAGEKIIEGTITAGTLNVQNIFADNETIRELIAANINVDTLFARQATVDALNATDITSNTFLRLMVSGKADQSAVDGLAERMDKAELKITEDAIVSTVTGSPKYQQDRQDILEKLNNGQITASNTAPENPPVDRLWLDTSITPNLLKRWNGNAWEIVNDTAALVNRLESAELKLTPDALTTAVRSSALYRYDRYTGRNYLLLSGSTYTFVDGFYYRNGAATTATGYQLSVSPDFFEHSGKLASFRISFDIKRTNVDASTASSAGTYFGMWLYYRYYADDGVTINTTGRGIYLYSHDADFQATDSNWVRLQKGPFNFSQYKPLEVAYFMLGTSAARGMTGTVQIRNVKLEVGDAYTSWCAALEDLNNLPNRMTTAESNITQHSNQLALTVSSATYNAEKITQAASAPASPTVGKLWLDTSLSPPIIKRWTGAAWVAVAAEEVKTSGIYIGTSNVRITTENFLLQLLDPANNENVLMEMAVNGYGGFKQLYADEVISASVAQAYAGPDTLYISPTYAIPVAAVEGLANGVYGGLCLFEPAYNFGSSLYSYDYMRFGGTDSSNPPYLRVVYAFEGGVG